MIHWLIYIGLAVTPFIFAPGRVDPAREPKMAWAVILSLLIGLYSLYKGKLTKFKNKYILALVFYILIAFYLSPNPALKFFGIPSGRFWSWEPLFYSVVFLLFLITISSIKFTKRHIDRLFTVMISCGVVMAGLVCLQSIHIMQFFEHRYGTYGYMAGTLGNPTLVGPFLGIIIPLALYKKKYIATLLMVYSLIATCSNVALFGLIVSMVFYVVTKSKKLFVIGCTTFLIACSIFATIYATNITVRNNLPDNERFITWKQSIQDLRTPVMQNSKKVYTVTGLGIGSFRYLYHAKHDNGFVYAHNEYINCLYELGIMGFLLFMIALFHTFKQRFSIKRIFNSNETRYNRAIMTSLVCSCACAGGMFIWQVGTHIFYTLIIIGLLHNNYNEEVIGE